jgi:hypothetical protein
MPTPWTWLVIHSAFGRQQMAITSCNEHFVII